jgi:hypothetical protein
MFMVSRNIELHQIKCYPGRAKWGGEKVSLHHGRMLPDTERNEDERTESGGAIRETAKAI